MAHPLLFESLHALGSSYLLKSGSSFSFFFLLLISLGLQVLKNFGATSTSHLGSIVQTSLMYSLVVSTNS